MFEFHSHLCRHLCWRHWRRLQHRRPLEIFVWRSSFGRVDFCRCYCASSPDIINGGIHPGSKSIANRSGAMS